MSVQLLDKTRKINKLLHNNHSHRVEFNDICEVLSGILESNILVISQKGKILGAASYSGIDKICLLRKHKNTTYIINYNIKKTRFFSYFATFHWIIMYQYVYLYKKMNPIRHWIHPIISSSIL